MAGDEKDLTDLVRRVQDRDPAAQQELYAGFRVRLAGFCRSKLDDPGEVDDCVQEVFETAFAGIDALRDPQALPKWLFTIADRKTAEYNRRRSRRPEPAEQTDFPDPISDPELDSRRRELLDTLADAVECLQPVHRSIMKVFIRENGLRGSELAARFGWRVKKADNELYEARTGLLKALGILVVVRTGRANCSQLDEMCGRLQIREGRFVTLGADQRRSVQRHITGCATCGLQARNASNESQWALVGPGVAELANYLTRTRPGMLDPDDEERRRAAVIAAERAGDARSRLQQTSASTNPATSVGSLAPTVVVPASAAAATADAVGQRMRLVGLAGRAVSQSRDAAAAAARRVAQLPGVNSLVQVAQANPGAFRLGGVFALVIALVAGAVMLRPPHDPPRPHQATTPTTTASPPPASPTGSSSHPAAPGGTGTVTGTSTPASGGGDTVNTSSSPTRSTDGGGSSTTHGETGGPPPPPPPHCSTDPSSGCPIVIDPSQLSYLTFQVTDAAGTPVTGWLDAQKPQALNLPPRVYRFYVRGAAAAPEFQVTEAGALNYTSQWASVLSGTGTPDLTVHGKSFTVDATPLSNVAFGITDSPDKGQGDGLVDSQDNHQKRLLNLLPGTYRFNVHGAAVSPQFQLTDTGTVDYTSQWASLLSGTGTPDLTVHGKDITIDATPLSYTSFGITNSYGNGIVPSQDNTGKRLLHLLPGPHWFYVTATMARPEFQVTDTGTVDYTSQWASVLSGEGTSTLTVSGLGPQVSVPGNTTDDGRAPGLDGSAVLRWLSGTLVLLLILVGLRRRPRVV